MKLNERVEASTSTYSATTDFLQYIYYALNNTIYLLCAYDINHGCRAAILKKTTSCFHEKLRRTMRTAIVSYLLKGHILLMLFYPINLIVVTP